MKLLYKLILLILVVNLLSCAKDEKKISQIKEINQEKELMITYIEGMTALENEDYFYASKKFLESEILSEILIRFKEHGTDILYLRADYQLDYGSVAKLMAMLKRGGVSKIALVTEIDKKD